MNKVVRLFKGRTGLQYFISEHLLSAPQRMILLSFFLVITIGTCLLLLPEATYQDISFIDALFTATSATCVTGLTVVNTVSTFTPFGQSIILLLIQLGGLGIMTFSTFFMFLFLGKLTISGREILVDTFSHNPFAELRKLITTVFIFTFVIELVGSGLLTIHFLPYYSIQKAIYYGVFHGISSFCNAGFSLIPGGYLPYATYGVFNLVNMLLIIAGGLGFIVIFDINAQLKYWRNGFFRRLSLHSKVVLATTGYLLAIGMLGFLLLEYNSSLKGYPLVDKLLISAFQSVSARTAGFNTVDFSGLSAAILFFIMVLMFIGASPGSCGGGIKTTTFALFTQNLSNQFSSNKDINIFQRRVPDSIQNRAFVIVFFALFTVVLFIFLLILTEVHLAKIGQNTPDILAIAFEVVSAFGTVGLSMGITSELSETGKGIITFLMFLGRLGPLTLVFALKNRRESNLRFMKEDLMVG